MSSFLEVSKKGLAKALAERGAAWPLLELLQNCLDENVTTVTATLRPFGRGKYEIRVEDDCPEGFKDLVHAYTLFAESPKKANPELRGRYDMGEKLVVARCDEAHIITTKGAIHWEGDTRRHGRQKRERGTVFVGVLRMTHAEADEACAVARTILCPPGIELTLNGSAIEPRERVNAAEASLVTVIGEDGENLRRSKRKTVVHVYETREGEAPMLYELGIPVVEIDCGWHVDVQQRVPLNWNRDNVTPAYLRDIQTVVVNAMHEELTSDSATAPWVSEALESKDIEPEAVRAIITARHGDKAVIADPSDREAEGLSVARGYHVVHGGSYSGGAWDNIKAAEAMLPAGKVNPSPKPFHPDGAPLKVIEEEDWTPGLRKTAAYVRRAARLATGKTSLSVTFANDFGWHFAGSYGAGGITLNVARLGRECLENSPNQRLDDVLIHELAHDKASNHLSEAFYDECTRIGAALMEALRRGELSY